MTEREHYTQRHPPACTCVDCNRRRLRRQQPFLSKLLGIFKRKRR